MKSTIPSSTPHSVDVRNTHVSEIMTDQVETIRYTDTVADALKLMAEDGHNTLPVVDENDRCVGMLSRSDLTEMFLLEDRELSRFINGDGVSLSNLPACLVDTCDDKRVRELMAHEVTTIDSDANIKQACRLMSDNDFHHLPVVDKERRIVGFVSSFDIIRWLAKDPTESV